jgi:hypothetical protein
MFERGNEVKTTYPEVQYLVEMAFKMALKERRKCGR